MTAERYIRQLLSSEEPRFACPRCGRTYKHKHILRRHVDFECGVEPKFACDLCVYKSKRKYELSLHMRTKHNINP